MTNHEIDHEIIKNENNDLKINFNVAGIKKDDIEVLLENNEIAFNIKEPKPRNKNETLIRNFNSIKNDKFIKRSVKPIDL